MSQDHKLRVLIVDDDPSIVKLLRRFAEDLSFSSVGCTSAEDALEFARGEDVRIALIDLHMPGMEGIELMRALRLVNSDIEVILVTGDSSSQAAEEAWENGAYECIWKPIDFDHLEQTLIHLREHVHRRIMQ